MRKMIPQAGHCRTTPSWLIRAQKRRQRWARESAMPQFHLPANFLQRGLQKIEVQTQERFPYGFCHKTAGREVLFDRNWRAIWQNRKDIVEPADPNEFYDPTRGDGDLEI